MYVRDRQIEDIKIDISQEEKKKVFLNDRKQRMKKLRKRNLIPNLNLMDLFADASCL